jgi:uncharacterized protein (TIGR00369 family)
MSPVSTAPKTATVNSVAVAGSPSTVPARVDVPSGPTTSTLRAWYEVPVTREGPFWDVMEGRADPPPAAALLGWELIAVDPEAGTIEVAFRATDEFLNPVGVVQGGLLAAMLDDTLGPALVATLGPGEFAPTTDLHVQYLRPARPGRLLGRGRIVRRGRDVGFLAGELLDQSGAVVAVATATAQIRRPVS